jgi:GxxExxY protein
MSILKPTPSPLDGAPHVQLVHEAITGVIRQTAFEVHRYFGPGFLEQIYMNALAHRLRKKQRQVQRQQHVCVRDQDDTVVGDYFADLVVDRVVLVEIKAVAALASVHTAQVLNYLKVTGLPVGLLINFGAPRLLVRRFLIPNPSPSAGSASSVARDLSK